MQRSSTRARAAAAALGLAVAVAVVAMAARAPLSRTTPVDARSAQAPTTALFMVLAGTGVVMLGALVLVVWPGRRRKDDPPEQEPTPIEVPWIWKLVAIVLSFALGAALVAAAVIGTRSVHAGPEVRRRVVRGRAARRCGCRCHPVIGAGSGFTVPAWLPWTLLAIVGVALAAGVVVLWLRRAANCDRAARRRARRVRRSRRRSARSTPRPIRAGR